MCCCGFRTIPGVLIFYGYIDVIYGEHTKSHILLYSKRALIYSQKTGRKLPKGKEKDRCPGRKTPPERIKTMTETRKMRNRRPENIYRNIFGASVTQRQYVPGRETYDRSLEKRRERADFRVIDDYIEQA